MSDALPPLNADAIVSIAREGGVAFFPGLAKPRQIRLSGCSEPERKQIMALLHASATKAAPAQGQGQGQGDQHYFRIEIHSGTKGAARPASFLIAAQHAPEGLVRLWESAAGQ